MADYKRKMGIEEDKDSPAYWREKESRRINKPSKYDSIRPAGEEERLSKRKSEGLKDAALGAGLAPVSVALETTLGKSDTENKGPIGAGATHLAGTGNRLVKSAKEAADFIGGGVSKYKKAKSEEADLDKELESQTKRESRGMKKGGKVKETVRGWGMARGARKAKFV
jgi:hypothetical protein